MPDGRSASPEAPVAPTNTAEGSKGPGFSAAPTKDSSPTRTPFEAAPTGEPKETGDKKTKTDTKTKEPEEPKKPAEPIEEPKKPDYEAAEVSVKKDEQGRYIATAANAQDNLEKRIRKEAQDQVREAQREGSAWNPLLWARKLKFKFGEDYYTQRGVQMLRQAAIDNNNVFIDMDVIHNSVKRANVRDADRGRDEHKSESRAKLEQIALGQQIEDDTSVQNVKEAQGRLKDLMVDEVFKPIVEGDVTTHAEVQKKLREFVENHENDADESVRSQLNEMFGRDATEFQERAQMFATDFLEVGQAIADDREAHNFSIDQIGEKIRIDIANAEWASSTELQFSRADKLATKLKGTKYGPYLNEATIGAITSVGTFLAFKGIGEGARAAGAAVGAGAVTGAAIGAYERNRNLKKDIAAHRARTEYGQNVDTTPRTDGLKGKLADQMNTSKKLEEFRYQEIASVDQLLHTDTDRSELGGDARSLDTLLEEIRDNGNNTLTRNALARRVAEIQERLHYSAEQGKGMIQFEGENQSEQGRLELLRGVVEGRQALEQALVDGGTSQEDARAEVADMLRQSRAQWEQRFTTDVKDQDAKFRTYRLKSAAVHGAFGGVVGIGSSLATQQLIAEIGAHTFDNKPVDNTILEEMGVEPDEIAETAGIDLESHSGPNSDAINDLKDALENNQPNDVVASFGEMGMQVHTENNQIIIDAVNGQPVDAAVPPTLTYDPESSTFSFQGELPTEVRGTLEENLFNVSEPTNPSEAVQANPQPELQTIPGTDMQVEIPLGTELREGADGTFDLYTKDAKIPTEISPITDARGVQLPEGALEGGGGTKIAEGLRFDATGHMVAGEITRPDIIQLGESRPGADTAMETNRWVEENSANAQVEQWYGNNTEGSDNNELKLYDRRVGPEAVQFDMMSMEESWQDGNFPPNVDVPQVIQEDRAVFTFWDKNNPDQPIIVRAEHGQVTLDKNSQDMVEVWKTKPDGTEGWVEVKNSEVAQAVLGDLGDFEEASDIGHTEILNYNVSAGDMQVQQSGEPLVSSYATAQGTGTPPETIGHPSEITTFQAVQTTEIEFPDGWEPMPIATPITPRRHLNEATENGPGEPGKSLDPNQDTEAPAYYGGKSIEELREWVHENPDRLQSYHKISNEDGKEVWADKEGKPVTRDIDRERETLTAYLDKIRESDPEYYATLESVANSPTFDSMTEENRVSINIPSWLEGKNIYDLLSEYTQQIDNNGEPLNPNVYEINLLINRKTGTPEDESIAEVQRFIEDAKRTGKNFKINYANVEFDPPYNNVGHARKVLTDAVLLRSLQRDRQDGALYMESEDADLVRVDPRTVINIINKLDSSPELDAVRGIQDRYPEVLMQNDFVFLFRRMWDIGEVYLRRQEYRPENNPRWNFTWNRVITGGWNTAYTAEAYALIDGYDSLQTKGEDMTIGEKMTMMRGDGNMPNLDVVGRVFSRTDSSPRRFLAEIFTGQGVYGPAFEDEAFNRDIKNRSLEEMLGKISDVSRINDSNKGRFAGMLNGYYQSAQDLTPDLVSAQRFYNMVMGSLGFMPEDYTYNEDGSVTINNWDHIQHALNSYRERNKIPYHERHPERIFRKSTGEESSNNTDNQSEIPPIQTPPPTPSESETSLGADTTLESETSTELPHSADEYSAVTLREEINERIRNTNETNTTFALTPEMLADFVKNNPQLFYENIAIDDLEARIVNNKLELNGSFMYNSKSQVELNNATFHVTPDGHITLEGNPDVNLDHLPFALRGVARRLINSRMRQMDEQFRNAINSQLENEAWGVEGFNIINGEISIALSNRPDVRRYSSAYGPEEVASAMPAPETITEPAPATETPPAPEPKPEIELEATQPIQRIEGEDITTLESARNVTTFINNELAAEPSNEHIFALEPNTLAEFLLTETQQASAAGQNDRLFGGNINFSDLDIRIEGGQVIISSRYNVRNRADMDVRQEVFEVNEVGRLVQVGRTRAKNNMGLIRARLPIAELDLTSFGDNLAAFMNQRINPNWDASGGFALVDGRLAMIVERRPEAPITVNPNVESEATSTEVIPLTRTQQENPPTAPLPITEIDSATSFNERLQETLASEQTDEHLFNVDPSVLSDYIYEESRDPQNLFGNVVSFAPRLDDETAPDPDRRRLSITVEGNAIVVNGDFTVNGQYNMRLEDARFAFDDEGILVPANEATISERGFVNAEDEARYGSDDRRETSRTLARAVIGQFGANLAQLIDRGLVKEGNRSWYVDGYRTFGNRLGLVTHRRRLQTAA